MISATPDLNVRMMVIIAKEGPLEAGRGRGRGRGGETGKGTGTVKVKVKVNGAETGTGTGTGREIGNMIRIGIITIGIEIGTEIEVREERGRELETEMMMITTGLGSMTGEEIMAEIGRRGTDIDPDLEGGDQNTNQGLGLDHAPKGKVPGVFSFFLMHVLSGDYCSRSL